jgi:hypothetical protein
MRMLDVTRLRDEDLDRLCALKQLNWGVLNESVGRCLVGWRAELLGERRQNGGQRGEIRDLENQAEQQGRETGEVRKEVTAEQSENAMLKATIDEQQRRIGELEGER